MRFRCGSAALPVLAGVALWAAACADQAEPEPARPRVRVAVVRTGAITERLELPARLVPPVDRDTILAPQVAGRLRRLPVAAGDEVAAGALLAEVDAAPLEDEQRSAEAGAASAREEEERQRRSAELTDSLFERGIASGEERAVNRAGVALAAAQRAEADARLARARRQLDWSLLRAPYAGVVVELFRHQGDVVDGTPATPVLRLAGRERTEALAHAGAAELARIAVGGAAELRDARGALTAAHVARVAAAVDPTSGLAEIRAVIDGPAPAPLFTDLRLALLVAVHEQALLVPATAIRRGEEGGEEIVVVDRGIARARPVKIGLRAGGDVELLSGATAGEQVVADEPLGIESGTAVEIEPSEAP